MVFRQFFMVIAACSGLAACSGGSAYSGNTDQGVDSAIETVKQNPGIAPDTMFNLNLSGKDYLMTLTRDEFKSKVDTNFQTITVRIINAGTHEEDFVATYDFNEIDGLRQPAQGCYWLTLVSNGGGSGFSGTVFQVRNNPEVTLQPFLNFDELTTWRPNKTGTSALVFRGIWNMNTDDENEEPESHFSEHQQSIALYTIGADTVRIQEIGLTEKKYDFYEDTTYSAFRKAEPALAGKIKWSEFE